MEVTGGGAFFKMQEVLPENWVHLLVGVKAKDTTKPKIRRGKDVLLLVASKEHTGDLPQSSVSLNSKTGEVFLFFVLFLFYLFIFGCVGSSLLCAGFL